MKSASRNWRLVKYQKPHLCIKLIKPLLEYFIWHNCTTSYSKDCCVLKQLRSRFYVTRKMANLANNSNKTAGIGDFHPTSPNIVQILKSCFRCFWNLFVSISRFKVIRFLVLWQRRKLKNVSYSNIMNLSRVLLALTPKCVNCTSTQILYTASDWFEPIVFDMERHSLIWRDMKMHSA